MVLRNAGSGAVWYQGARIKNGELCHVDRLPQGMTKSVWSVVSEWWAMRRSQRLHEQKDQIRKVFNANHYFFLS